MIYPSLIFVIVSIEKRRKALFLYFNDYNHTRSFVFSAEKQERESVSGTKLRDRQISDMQPSLDLPEIVG